jgi:hypothetical protein
MTVPLRKDYGMTAIRHRRDIEACGRLGSLETFCGIGLVSDKAPKMTT